MLSSRKDDMLLDGTMKAVLKNVSKKWLSDIREVVSLVERFHMGVFYIHGKLRNLELLVLV